MRILDRFFIVGCPFYIDKSVLRRMQTTGSGAEFDHGALGILRVRRRAVPETRTAMDALLAIEARDALLARRDRLAGAGLDADLRPTDLAQIGVEEDHMVRIPR